jgi:hypothetical protein
LVLQRNVNRCGLNELSAPRRTEEMANSEVLFGRLLRRRSTGGPTARETSPPPAPGQTQVCYRDIALDARAVGSSLGSCLLIEFDGAAIGSSPRGHAVCARPRGSATSGPGLSFVSLRLCWDSLNFRAFRSASPRIWRCVLDQMPNEHSQGPPGRLAPGQERRNSLQRPHSTETTARPFTPSGTFTAKSSNALPKTVNAK